MALSKEELLKPRYKVIAKFPNMSSPVGTVVAFNGTLKSAEEDFCKLFNEYPAVYKKLGWWEERATDEMPGYLTRQYVNSEKREVVKVKEWVYGLQGLITVDGRIAYTDWFQPATLSEYEAFINQQK